MRDKNTSRHHLIAQFHGWLWYPENIVRINNHVHQAFHVVFSHETPVEQFQHILDLNQRALSPAIIQEMQSVLDRYSWIMELNAYNPQCVNVSKFIYSKNLK
mgnify:CR=1 FL=1